MKVNSSIKKETIAPITTALEEEALCSATRERRREEKEAETTIKQPRYNTSEAGFVLFFYLIDESKVIRFLNICNKYSKYF